jgi:arylsulfatase
LREVPRAISPWHFGCCGSPEETEAMKSQRFSGRIALDVRNSKPDWTPFLPPKATDGAPNVLYIVWDDVGFGALDCFGGLIETPNMTRLAESAVHAATSGWSGFDKDRWELFNLEEDRSQTNDLASRYPEKLEELKTIWAMLAGQYQALPLDDRTPVEVLADQRPKPGKPRSRYIYYPNCEPVGQGVGVNIAQRSFDIAAEVTVENDKANGVIFAQGSDIGGHTLYVKDGHLTYVYNWLGEIQQKITSSAPLTPGRHTLGVTFDVTGHDKTKSPLGPARLFTDGKEVAADNFKTQPGFFGLEGVITIGRDIGRPASDEYRSPDTWSGGTIEKVTVSVKGKRHTDPKTEAEMARRRD